MNSRYDLEELLTAARVRVRAACVLLMRPYACDTDACLALFRQAQADLERLRDALSQDVAAGARWQAPTAALAGEIRHAGALLERAARYGRRWLERLQGVSPEYDATGDRPARSIRRRVSCLG